MSGWVTVEIENIYAPECNISLQCSQAAVSDILEWYAGDEYRIKINGETVEPRTNGAAYLPLRIKNMLNLLWDLLPLIVTSGVLIALGAWLVTM